jgi:hypothetical protein
MKYPNGPFIQFRLNELRTAGEVKMPGNCVKGSK